MIRRARLVVLVFVAGCGGATTDPGIDALFQVNGAQFARGPMPTGSADGPAVASVVNTRTNIIPGEHEKPLQGAVALDAKGVAIGMKGDIGYWVVPSSPPTFEVPNFLSFDVTVGFSAIIPPGPFEVDVAASDAQGRFGLASPVQFVAEASTVPSGSLVITLRWDTEADLDLHVVDPNGTEIWSRNINSFPKPPVGVTPDPMQVLMGGILDFDSNANCVIDGRREENVVWMMMHPPGHYLVRVDTFSLCGQVAAHWTVEARHQDQVFLTAHGTSTDTDTRFPHDAGAGVLALEFDEM
jgi:hypothetical protein